MSMLITFDERNRRKNLWERGLDFADLTIGFFENAAIIPAKENRFMAITHSGASHSRRDLQAARVGSHLGYFDAPGVGKRKETIVTSPNQIRRAPDGRFQPRGIVSKCAAIQQRRRPVPDADEAEIQRQIAADPDDAELTDEQTKQRMTFADAFPDLVESIARGRGRPAIDNPKRPISLRLSPDVIDAFKATGKGWQTRIDEALREAAGHLQSK